VRYDYLKADGYGKVRIDARHYYSTRPEYAGREVLVAIRAHSIDILDDHKRLVVRIVASMGNGEVTVAITAPRSPSL